MVPWWDAELTKATLVRCNAVPFGMSIAQGAGRLCPGYCSRVNAGAEATRKPAGRPLAVKLGGVAASTPISAATPLRVNLVENCGKSTESAPEGAHNPLLEEPYRAKKQVILPAIHGVDMSSATPCKGPLLVVSSHYRLFIRQALLAR